MNKPRQLCDLLGQQVEILGDAEISTLIDALQAESDRRQTERAVQPIMQDLADTFGKIFGKRSPFKNEYS